MDTSGSGFLRALPGFGGLVPNTPEMSARDKRVQAQVEKTLASFDALEEWADYIAFLARLKKSLAVPAESPHSVLWIPLSEQVLAKLALCLLPMLPNGVHRKLLELYEAIFDSLAADALNSQISVWLPGILPVVSFGLMQVKPQVIKLYETKLFRHLTPATLKQITKPILLSLLCGLDDENSEVFNDVMLLLDAFKAKLDDNAHFWQAFFVCVITSPEKRLGALNWCILRLPLFARIVLDTGSTFSAEALACLASEPGLIVRAFAAALNTRLSFNQATDIIVMRGFFDLLLSHLPLDSPVMLEVVSPVDKQLLIMACCKVTLKKDMSLNRRLWKWLLGPDSLEDLSNLQDQKAYFEKTALSMVESGLKALLASDAQLKLDAYNIVLAMIMDRWEISQLITSRLFVPIIESCFHSHATNDPASLELLAAGKRVFDEVEAHYIWQYICNEIVLSGDNEKLQVLDFLLQNFQFPDDEENMHVWLATLAFLMKHEVSVQSVFTLTLLMELTDPKLLTVTGGNENVAVFKEESILDHIILVHSSPAQESDKHIPTSIVSQLVAKRLEHWYVQSMNYDELSDKMASLLSNFLTCLPRNARPQIDTTSLKSVLLAYPEFCWKKVDENELNASVIFGMVKLIPFVKTSMSFSEKSKLIKILLSNLWATLVSLYPANHQVEAVRCIFDLQLHFSAHEIEAGISYMLLQTPEVMRIHSFYKLWSLSQDITDCDALLSNPLFVVLDSFKNIKPESLPSAQKFVHLICTDGSANRFLKLISSPLLTFAIMRNDIVVARPQDDFKLFAYYIETILNILRSSERSMKDIMAHEFVATENAEKFELFNSNGWEVANYKTLLLDIVRKFLKLKISACWLEHERPLFEFTACTAKVLELYTSLISGSEPDFVDHFDLIVETCLYYILEIHINPAELDILETILIKYIQQFLSLAKSMNANVLHYEKGENSGSPSFVAFVSRGIARCTSATLLEKWFSLMKSTLYMLDNSIFGEMLNFNHTILEKIAVSFAAVEHFEKLKNCVDAEALLTVCLSGLEDLLSISHSYLVTPSLSTGKPLQGENGFFGNVILGVFQIESPLVKSEEEQRIYSVIVAFQDAIRAAFDVWSWADSKPSVKPGLTKYSSQKSITHVSNKLKFRSKKVLESLSELERQETIEAIIETNKPIETKIKILHVLDSGHSQLSLPHILNSIMTRCSPQVLTDKQKSTMYSSVTEARLCEFLIPYYSSIDLDTLDEIWDMSVAFFKEVSLHPMHFKQLLLTVLQVMKVVSLKAQARKLNDSKRNLRELTNYFLSILNASVNKHSYVVPSEKRPSSSDKDGEVQDGQIESLTSLVESLSIVIQEHERVNTAVTTIVSTVVLNQAKPKTPVVPLSVLKLMLAIGRNFPIKPWKQVVLDTFVDASFFKNEKYNIPEWRDIMGIWINSDKERMAELVNKITPPVQTSAANIFIWNESSEVEDRAMVLRRVTYLILVQPKDFFVKNLDDIIRRLSTALDSSCPALYRNEALTVFRALSLKFSEGHLLPYWSLVVQSLVEVFSGALAKNAKQFSAIDASELKLILSACKLLDQLLLLKFDEVNLTSWLFVSRGSVANDEAPSSLIDRLAAKSESLLTKEDPVNVSGPSGKEKASPLLMGISEIKNIANLKKFFGLLGYINFERSYGLCEPDLDACETDLLQDMGKH
ncbi:Dopey, N-terminal [Metschnikowia aff. pulcherrima]|uniref:Dopey, N-terminal n=1 Tax=Metschnikowia aff. pulcherrima TaxID=2163413 RepID=A0A4P6XVU5_9ASCO|nr:Dopey, N-terminal [Metschnikowia aff. pulcherrima]